MVQLLTFDQLAPWQKDNKFVRSGYRRLTRSYWKCLGTIFQVHNESVNIVCPLSTNLSASWTHLFGSLLAVFAVAYLLLDLSPTSSLSKKRQGWYAPFAGIPYHFPHESQPSVTFAETVGLALFLVSVAVCLGFSAFFHTFMAHSKEICHRWNRLDYVGIVVLISGTFPATTHLGFFCKLLALCSVSSILTCHYIPGDPHLRDTYIGLIYVAAAATIMVVISPQARTPAYRRMRTWLFISLGLSAVFPVGHAVYRYGLEEASANISLFWLVLGGALYIAGALLYAERCPERFAPGKLDFFGSSHQIFHVLILLAAWSHFTCITEGFRYHHGERGGRCEGRV
ncbi:SPOSA6832_00404 [Sporobolomyces salmonicolor]|uniref:SPOSA6832_00404-mRNA-1:cds n=1 Tax=Sporidiobolus salmonicolor TaxID=5005 RepID=A0A0D6EG37_SPOSA|nr:SPOSA6832_00404 [Sporobolomyces salmonicolor]